MVFTVWVLSHSLAFCYLHQGPTGKPGLPGMPGADGPPVCSSLYSSFIFPLIKTETECFIFTKCAFSKCPFSLSRVTQERRGLQGPKETRLVTHNPSNHSKKQKKLKCIFNVSFVGVCWSIWILLWILFKGPNGPQGPIGYPGPRGLKVSLILLVWIF